MSILIQNRQAAGSISPRISRIVAGLLIVSMLVNGFVPRFAINGNTRSVLAGALTRNSLLLQYFSLSVLPLAVVNTLFKERASGSPSKAPGEQDESGSNSSSDFSLINGDTRLNQSRSESVRTPFFGIVAAAAQVSSFVPEARAPDDRAFPLPVIIGSLLLCFFLFARSSVNEDAVVIRRRYALTRFR